MANETAVYKQGISLVTATPTAGSPEDWINANFHAAADALQARQDAIDAVNATLGTLAAASAITSLQAEIDATTTALASKALASDLTAEVAARTAADTQLGNQLATKAAASDVTTLAGTVSTLGTTVAGKAAQSSVDALTTTVATKAAATDVAALAGQVQTKAAQADLTAETTARTAADGTLTSAVASKAAASDLTAETAARIAAVSTLTTSVGTKAAQSALDSLVTTVGTKAAASDLASLGTTVGTLNGSLTSLQGTVSNIQVTYLNLNAAENVITGSKLYFSPKALEPTQITDVYLVDGTSDGGSNYLSYTLTTFTADGQYASSYYGYCCDSGTIRVNLSAALAGATYKLWRYNDNDGTTCLMGTWTAATLPAYFDDDLSSNNEDYSQPNDNVLPTRLLDTAAQTLELDGVTVSATGYYGSGAGLYSLPSPFNQTLNTNNTPMFSGMTLRSPYSYNGAISNLFTLQSYDPYGVHTQTQINNVGQMVMGPFFQNSDAIGVEAYGLNISAFYNQQGNRPAATILVNHGVLGYGSGRIVFLDLQDSSVTKFAIDVAGKCQWTTNAAEGLVRNSSTGNLEYTDTSGFTSVVSGDASLKSLKLTGYAKGGNVQAFCLVQFGTYTSSSGFQIVPNQKVTDPSNLFSNSTYCYTAPTTGIYRLTTKLRVNDAVNASSYGQGAGTTNADGAHFGWYTTEPQRNGSLNVRIAQFNAGDQIRMYTYFDGAYSIAGGEMAIELIGITN